MIVYISKVIYVNRDRSEFLINEVNEKIADIKYEHHKERVQENRKLIFDIRKNISTASVIFS